MPRFFFNIEDEPSAYSSEVDLPDLATARHQAVKTACAIIQKHPTKFWSNGGEWQMTVTNELGLTLFSLTFYATDAPAIRTCKP